MVDYALEPTPDVDPFGNPFDDPDWEMWMEPEPGWSEWTWEGPNRRLFVFGKPPPPEMTSAIIRKADITGVMITSLEPDFRDLHWLQPEALADSSMREFEVSPVGGRVDLTSLAECNHLEMLAVAPRLTSSVDLTKWTPTIKRLGITQGSPARYQGIQALQGLEFLSVDLPGGDISYVGELPELRQVRFTAASKVTAVPLSQDQHLESILVHRSPTLDLSFLSNVSNTLTELELDGIRNLVNFEALRLCTHLKTIVLENCGPRIRVDDLLHLMHRALLRRVTVIGDSVPFDAKDRA